MVGSDWIKLYNVLPFYPVRNSEDLKQDVDEICENIHNEDHTKVRNFSNT